MTGIAFLIRETAARGIRVRAGVYGQDMPEGAHELWTTVRRGNGGTPGPDGKLVQGKQGLRFEMLVPGGPMANGRPVMWWTLERQVGMGTVQKRVRSVMTDVPIGLYAPDWEEAAGTLLETMQEMSWVYELAVIGEAFTPRSEWLACDVCGEAQMLSKSKGSATAKQKCHMKLNCAGFVRRLPLLVEVTTPKVLTTPKPKAVSTAPKPEVTPGAERFKKKTTVVTIEEWIDESYDEESVDTSAA
jgi:hypothetical protein